jgi:hypothetical protein
MADNNALNLVDTLLNNEKPDKPKQKKVFIKKKRPSEPGEYKGNPRYNPDEPQEYWPGDTIQISDEDKKNTRLPANAFLVATQTPSFHIEACVYCPWYSIYGWGESTRGAIDACINSIVEYWENYPIQAQAIVDGFEGFTPKQKKLKNLRNKDMGEILMDEGL